MPGTGLARRLADTARRAFVSINTRVSFFGNGIHSRQPQSKHSNRGSGGASASEELCMSSPLNNPGKKGAILCPKWQQHLQTSPHSSMLSRKKIIFLPSNVSGLVQSPFLVCLRYETFQGGFGQPRCFNLPNAQIHSRPPAPPGHTAIRNTRGASWLSLRMHSQQCGCIYPSAAPRQYPRIYCSSCPGSGKGSPRSRLDPQGRQAHCRPGRNQ